MLGVHEPQQRYLFFGRHKLGANEAPMAEVNARFRSVRRAELIDLRNIENTGQAIWPDEKDRASYPTTGGEPPVDYYGATVFPYGESGNVYIMLAQAFWHWMPPKDGNTGAPGTRDVRLAVGRRRFEAICRQTHTSAVYHARCKAIRLSIPSMTRGQKWYLTCGWHLFFSVNSRINRWFAERTTTLKWNKTSC